jgi:multicomponent Na+:H+ antiporter subunit D
MSTILVVAVLAPLLGAVSCLFHRSLLWQRTVAFATLSAAAVAAVALLVEVAANGTVAVAIGGLPGSFAINYVADRLAVVMVVVALVIVTVVLGFAVGQRAVDERSDAYHPVYLVLAAGIAHTFFAGDLFNLFVGFELMLIASYVLLTLDGDDDQIRAGTTYVVLNVIESMVLLTAVGLIFAATGTVNMAELPERLAALPDGVRTGLNLLLLVAFGIKAAVFPLYFWLPDAYPTAPSSVTAVFAGLLTKVGAYGILRTETLLFPGAQSNLLLVVAVLTMVVGVIGAVSHAHMKRILSFHIVSQIGYVVMGIGIGGEAAIAATIFFLLHQIPAKTALFLVEGLVERETGASAFDQVGGLARRSWAFALLFMVPAFSLAGLPPLSGFLAKFFLVREGFDAGQTTVAVVALAVSLFTLVSMTKIWMGLFWGEVMPTPVHDRPGLLRHYKLMTLATVVVVGAGIAISVAAGPIYDFALDAARDIVDPLTYVKAVTGP